jgi:hypothetical protein
MNTEDFNCYVDVPEASMGDVLDEWADDDVEVCDE